MTFVVAHFGRLMASDIVGEIKDRIYILPSLSFYFNHSEVCIEFCFLNFRFQYWHKNYLKHDKYLLKLAQKQHENL